MTLHPETEASTEQDLKPAEAERLCNDLQHQLERARELMEQSRRFLRAATVEPRSFKPRE